MNYDGKSKTLYPGTVDAFHVSENFPGSIDFVVTARLANIAQWPSAFLQLDSVGIHEPFNYSAYPMPLPRQVSVGGSVNTVGGIASQVVQLGSTGAQNLVQGSVSPDAGLSISILTDGNVIFGDASHPGSLTVQGNIKSQAQVISNTGFYNLDNGGVARLFGQISGSNNDNIIATNVNNKILHVVKNDLSGDIATFADTLVTSLLGLLNLTGQSPTTINGSVAGNVTFVAPIWGSGLKVLICQLNGWNSASVGTFTFPATGGQAINNAVGIATRTLGAMTFGFFIGGTAKSVYHMLTLGAAGAAGSDESVTALHGDNVFGIDSSSGLPTSMQVGTTGGVAITGTIAFFGN